MRWYKPQTGAERVIKKFAIYPIRIGNEVRWLETCIILQVAYDVDYYLFPWKKEKFLNE